MADEEVRADAVEEEPTEADLAAEEEVAELGEE